MNIILAATNNNNHFSAQARKKTDQILQSKAFNSKHLGFIKSFLNFINRMYNDSLGKVFNFLGHSVHTLFSDASKRLGVNGPTILILIFAIIIGLLIYFIIRKRQHVGSNKEAYTLDDDFESIDSIQTLLKLLTEAETAKNFNRAARICFRISLIQMENAGILIKYENRTIGQINDQLKDVQFYKLACTIEMIVYSTLQMQESNYKPFKEDLSTSTTRILKTFKKTDNVNQFDQIESMIA